MSETSQRTKLIAGIFVLCGLVLLGGLIFEFGPLQHMMRRPYTIYAVFNDARSLIRGAPVRAAGAQIGKVASVPELMPGLGGVKVALEIYPEFKIPRGSPLKITDVGLMGDSAVDVGKPPDGSEGFVREGETLTGERGTDLQGTASRLGDEGSKMMNDMRATLDRLNIALDRINSGILSDANVMAFSDSITRVHAALEKFDSEVLSPANVAAVRDLLALLVKTADSAVFASAKAGSALDKADKAFENLGPGVKGLAAAAESLRDAGDALQGLLRDARSGKGVLHALLNDPVVRSNLEQFIANLKRSGPLFYKDRPPSAPPRSRPDPARSAVPFKKR